MRWLAKLLAIALLAAPGLALARDDDRRGREGDEHRGRMEAPQGYERSYQGDRGYGDPRQGRGAPSYYGPPAPPSYPPPPPRYPSQQIYRTPAYRPPIYAPVRPYNPGRYGVSPSYGAGWRRGEILPPDYRGYAVPDYARYHLRRPPRGYYWCRAGDDFVLVAMTTGLIFEVIGADRY